MAQRTAMIWTDAQGENALHVITTAVSGAAIPPDLANLSNAFISSQWAGTNVIPATSGSTDTYPTVRVTAQLIYRNATGSIAKLWIPAPMAGMFLADGVTVDPTAVAGLNMDVLGNLLAGDGTPVTQYVGGQLWQQKISGIASLQVFSP